GVSLVAARGKYSNRQLLGRPRTYARLQDGAALDYASWIEAVRAGRTTVTLGPLLQLTANDQGPGSVLDLPSDATAIHISAKAASLSPFDRIEVVANNQVVASSAARGSP